MREESTGLTFPESATKGIFIFSQLREVFFVSLYHINRISQTDVFGFELLYTPSGLDHLGNIIFLTPVSQN